MQEIDKKRKRIVKKRASVSTDLNDDDLLQVEEPRIDIDPNQLHLDRIIRQEDVSMLSLARITLDQVELNSFPSHTIHRSCSTGRTGRPRSRTSATNRRAFR